MLGIGNAAGTAKYPRDTAALLRSAASRITVGSITRNPRVGNAGDVYFFDDVSRTSINAMGLPGPGLTSWLDALPALAAETHHCGKTLFASVSGFSTEEFAFLCIACAAVHGLDGIEINLSCPNIHGANGRKPILSYDPEAVNEVLSTIKRVFAGKSRPRIAVKISPVEQELVPALARVFAQSGIVDEVVACNTVPDQQMKKGGGSEALAFRPSPEGEVKHTGGLAGAPLKRHSLRTVATLRALLPDNISITGVGGIFTGQDALDFIEAGAHDVQVGTGFLEYGPGIFSDILQQLADIPGAERYLV